MKHRLTFFLVSLSIGLSGCFDDDKARSESSSSATSGAEQATQIQDDSLSDEQVKTLRHYSQALLRARLEQKNQRQGDITPDRERLNRLQGIVGELERQLNAEQMRAVLNPAMHADAAVSGLEIDSKPAGSFRYQPASQTFVEEASDQEESMPASSASNDQRAAKSKTQSVNPVDLQKRQQMLSSARASLTSIKQSLNAEQSSQASAVLARLRTSLGFADRKPRAVADAERNALLLGLVSEAEAVVQAIETDQASALPKLRQLKRRLTLQTPGTTLSEAEPTIVSLTEHRQ